MKTNNAYWKTQFSRQSFVLLTDLLSMLTVLEEDYQLEYSESYTGNVYGGATTEVATINIV